MKHMKNISILSCCNACPLYYSDADGMKCGHPFFFNKDSLSAMIITQDNCKYNTIPEKCPLRNEPVELVSNITLKL